MMMRFNEAHLLVTSKIICIWYTWGRENKINSIFIVKRISKNYLLYKRNYSIAENKEEKDNTGQGGHISCWAVSQVDKVAATESIPRRETLYVLRQGKCIVKSLSGREAAQSLDPFKREREILYFPTAPPLICTCMYLLQVHHPAAVHKRNKEIKGIEVRFTFNCNSCFILFLLNT